MRQAIDAELQKASSQPTGQAANQAATANQSSNVAVVVNNNSGAKTNVGNSGEKK